LAGTDKVLVKIKGREDPKSLRKLYPNLTLVTLL